MKCPACGSHFRAEDLDAARDVLTCRYCNALTLLPAAARAGSGQRARPEVPLPARLRIEEGPQGLEIRRRWFQFAYVFLLFFCIAWDGFLVFWYAFALHAHLPPIMALFPIVHVFAGVVLTYTTLAGLMNTTTITVAEEALRIRHAPLPWPGSRTIPAASVAQLYCKQRVDHGKNGSSTTYEVWIALHEGPSRKLVGGLTDAEQALFIEQRVEKALGLADRPMADELAR